MVWGLGKFDILALANISLNQDLKIYLNELGSCSKGPTVPNDAVQEYKRQTIESTVERGNVPSF